MSIFYEIEFAKYILPYRWNKTESKSFKAKILFSIVFLRFIYTGIAYM